MKLKIFFTVCCSFLAVFASAQKGKVTGKVIDALTGEELIGVTVIIKSTLAGTTTDIDGRFVLEHNPTVNDTLIIKYLSYQTKKLPITIEADKSQEINVALEDAINEITEVVVQGVMKKETINNQLIEQKKANIIGNGISAEAIKQSPDNNSGEAIKRVSGATLQGGKFAIIRGLNERYNIAMINNSPLPSTEPEKRAFALDLFPSNMLDQILIIKSASADQPGDWAGGIIMIKTREVPEEPFFNIGLGGTYNNLTTFQKFQRSAPGPADWLGAGYNYRALPSDFPSTNEIFALKSGSKRKELAALGSTFANGYAPQTLDASPNLSINLSGGKMFKLKNSKLGIIFSGLYGNSKSFKTVERNWWTADGVRALNYNDSTWESDVRIGGLLNLQWKIGQNHKLTFKNTYNHNGEDIFTTRNGYRDAEGNYLKSYSYQYTFNRMLYSQLSGEHVLGAKAKLFKKEYDFSQAKITWDLAYGNTRRDLPNYRNVEYVTQSLDDPFTLKILPQNGSEDISNLYTNLKEQLKSAAVNFETPYRISKKIRGSAKIGYFHQYKDRAFSGRFLSFSRPTTNSQGSFNFDILRLPIDRVFDASSFFYAENGKHGLLMDEITRPYHSYSANASLHATYISMETNLGIRHRVIYGVRYEAYHQRLNSKDQNNKPIEIDTTWKSVLPSVNYVFSVSEKTNLRASYFKSVSRPEFRELAPFAFLDFQTFSILRGNSNLELTRIDNAELRYEYYPSAGEVLSMSVFYKKFDKPIELLLDNSITLGAIGRLYANLPSATSVGFELDFRKNLGFLDTLINRTINARRSERNNKEYRSSFMSRFTIYGNFSYIKSEIDLQGETNTYNAKRPMQGQSPYIINTGLQYQTLNKKWTITALFNRYGERISSVGTANTPDIYEKSRSVLDFQISRKFFKDKFEAKIGIADLFAQDLVYFFDYDRDGKYSTSSDRLVYRYIMPRMVSFGASYKF